jgi:hypothetical protein
MRTNVVMGAGPGDAPAGLDLEELLATRLLVQGNSGSGKSYLLRRLLEQSAGHVQQAIIDPEGDFVTLAERYGHVVVEAGRSEADLSRVALRVRQHRASVVLNLEGLDAEEQMRSAAAFLNGLFDADREHWYPLLVVVDEAQLFAPAVAGEVSDEARKLSLGAMTNLMCRGRKRGLAGVIATQRLAKLAKNVAAEASNFLMGRTFLDIDMARAADLLGMERRQAEMFRDLERGQFVALGPALSRRPLPVRIGAVETEARSTSPRLMPLPEAPADGAMILAPMSDDLPPRPRRQPAPRPTADILEQLAQELANAPRAADGAERAGEPAEGREAMPEPLPGPSPAEIAAIVEEVLAAMVEEEAADGTFRPAGFLYQDFAVRCRIRRVQTPPLDLTAFRRRLLVARAATGLADPADEAWRIAVEVSSILDEDLQAAFLLIARAAIDGAPCPTDAAIARAFGSHSPGRGRRAMAALEQQGVLVCRSDIRGHRIGVLPDLARETAACDPRAATG